MSRLSEYIVTPRDIVWGVRRAVEKTSKASLYDWIGFALLFVIGAGLQIFFEVSFETTFFWLFAMITFYWKIEARVAFIGILVCLIIIPVFLFLFHIAVMSSGEAWAERAAIWAFYFLIIGVAKLFVEHWREYDGAEDDEDIEDMIDENHDDISAAWAEPEIEAPEPIFKRKSRKKSKPESMRQPKRKLKHPVRQKNAPASSSGSGRHLSIAHDDNEAMDLVEEMHPPHAHTTPKTVARQKPSLTQLLPGTKSKKRVSRESRPQLHSTMEQGIAPKRKQKPEPPQEVPIEILEETPEHLPHEDEFPLVPEPQKNPGLLSKFIEDDLDEPVQTPEEIVPYEPRKQPTPEQREEYNEVHKHHIPRTRTIKRQHPEAIETVGPTTRNPFVLDLSKRKKVVRMDDVRAERSKS